QDADVVLFVYREEYYHQMRKPLESNREKFAEWLAEADKVHGKAEVIIGKQRHGPTGTVELQFDAAVTRFSSLAPDVRLPDRTYGIKGGGWTEGFRAGKPNRDGRDRPAL